MNVELNLYKALAAYMESRGGLDDGPLAEITIPIRQSDSRLIVPVVLLKEHPDDNVTKAKPSFEPLMQCGHMLQFGYCPMPERCLCGCDECLKAKNLLKAR